MRQLNIRIATNIKKMRKKQGYTQRELAEKCHHSKSTISKIEGGQLPSVITLCDLASCLKCSPNDICGWNKNKAML